MAAERCTLAVLVVCGLTLLVAARANGALPSGYYYRLTREFMHHAARLRIAKAATEERLELCRELPSSQLKVARAHPSFGFATNRSLVELENPLLSMQQRDETLPCHREGLTC